MKQIEEGRGTRPYKVWDSGRQVRKGLVASSFIELVERGKEKLDLVDARIRVVLEADGTQVEDSDYFSSLPENTIFLLLRQGEHWYPAGVEVLRQAITAIPRIVCETIYSLGLHDEAPVWKVMDQYGKITVVLSWDPCHHRGESHKHGSSSPRKPSATARVIVSGIGESTTQRHELLNAQTSFGSTPSPIPLAKSPVPGSIGVSGTSVVHGTVTTIYRDGKKETLINDVGTSVAPSVHQVHQGTVINHESEHKSSYIGASGAGVIVGRLSRQGSSVESTHSATVHIHTPECCSYGHPTPTPRTRVSPTGEQSECDFHCCALHEEGGRIHSSRHYAQQQQQVQKKQHQLLQTPHEQHRSQPQSPSVRTQHVQPTITIQYLPKEPESISQQISPRSQDTSQRQTPPKTQESTHQTKLKQEKFYEHKQHLQQLQQQLQQQQLELQHHLLQQSQQQHQQQQQQQQTCKIHDHPCHCC